VQAAYLGGDTLATSQSKELAQEPHHA
jgi:hypothetical protein